jgi:V8-like Glu-specific endopeptidase
MDFKFLIRTTIFFSCITANYALADVNKFIQEKQNSIATIEYWTPVRLKHAKELTLPLVDANTIKTVIPKQMLEQQKNSKPQSKEPLEPTVEVAPNLHPIFQYTTQSQTNSKLRNKGKSNNPFSSSRAVPTSADLEFPYRTVGKLFFTIPSQGDFFCSASVIDLRIILTAGHCVHSGDSLGFFTNFLFIPSFHYGLAPFFSWTSSFAIVTDDWANGGGFVPNVSDFAVLEINDQLISGASRKIGQITGTLGFQTQSLTDNHVHILGYPANLDNGERMHQVIAGNGPIVTPNNVIYGSDMLGGSDGGPWIQNFGVPSVGQTGGLNSAFNKVVGVTSWGLSEDRLAEGSSIPDANFTSIISAICAHQPGNCA